MASDFTPTCLWPCFVFMCSASPAEQPITGQAASVGSIQIILPQVAWSSGTIRLSPPPPGGPQWSASSWQGSRQELGFLRSPIPWLGLPTLCPLGQEDDREVGPRC